MRRSAAIILRNTVIILAQLPNTNLTREVKSTQVIARFCLRMTILIIFAAFGSIGFDRSLTALLWMSTILSALLATIRYEEPLDSALNHWDEAMAYAALCCLISGFDHTLSI
jgi:hypothetical protein